MELFTIAFLVLVGSFVAFAAWTFRIRALVQRPAEVWMCLVCQIPNEGERDDCWSCGRPAGESPKFPSPRDREARTPCETCGLLNPVALNACVNCGRTLPRRGE